MAVARQVFYIVLDVKRKRCCGLLNPPRTVCVNGGELLFKGRAARVHIFYKRSALLRTVLAARASVNPSICLQRFCCCGSACRGKKVLRSLCISSGNYLHGACNVVLYSHGKRRTEVYLYSTHLYSIHSSSGTAFNLTFHR